jgi:hypothetical protein
VVPFLPPSTAAKPESIVDLLRHLRIAIEGGDTVTVGHMLRLFGVRGFAFLLFVLALMNIVIFMVPGISLLFGVPMVILAVQMVLGLTAPVFPAFIRNRAIKCAILERGLDIGIRGVEKVEHLIRPRFPLLFGPHRDRFHSFLALVMAILVALPVPVMNVPPSLAVIALTLGMMQRDGLFVVLAYAIAAWSLWLYKSLGHMAQMLVN